MSRPGQIGGGRGRNGPKPSGPRPEYPMRGEGPRGQGQRGGKGPRPEMNGNQWGE